MKNLITILLTAILFTACAGCNKEVEEKNKYVDEMTTIYKQAAIDMRNAKNVEECKKVAENLKAASEKAKQTYQKELVEYTKLQITNKELYNKFTIQMTIAAGEFNKASDDKIKEFKLKEANEKSGNVYVDTFIETIEKYVGEIELAKSEAEVEEIAAKVKAEISESDEKYAKEKAEYEALAKAKDKKGIYMSSKMQKAYSTFMSAVDKKMKEFAK